MSSNADTQGWSSTTLNSLGEAMAVFAELRGRAWLCRGQSSCHRGLLPTIDRGVLRGLDRLKKLTLERQSIDLFRSTAQFFSDPGEQAAVTSDIGALMVLRHYDVPTRLLDWSLSPYVAAYFAACDNDSADGEIWSFDESLYAKKGTEQWTRFPETTIDGSGDPAKFDHRLTTAFGTPEPSDWFVCQFYPGGFHRQTAQTGAYTFTPRFDRDHADAIARLLGNRKSYHRYVVSAKLKVELRAELREKHGIWRGSLFPDAAGAAATARTVFPDGV